MLAKCTMAYPGEKYKPKKTYLVVKYNGYDKLTIINDKGEWQNVDRTDFDIVEPKDIPMFTLQEVLSMIKEDDIYMSYLYTIKLKNGKMQIWSVKDVYHVIDIPFDKKIFYKVDLK